MGSTDKATKRFERKLKRGPKSIRKNQTLLNSIEEGISKRHVKPSRQELKPLTDAQVKYDNAIHSSAVTFGIGPAGTGKTWWAAMRAAEALAADKIERIVVTRPAVEAGESLGFLPGEQDEKYEPYFRPVRDALEEYLGSGALEYHLKAGNIEARPLAYLRGATLKNCWVILDEAQNLTPSQMKMFLTRIGSNAKFIINGDPSQKDIPGPSGLVDALHRLKGLGGVSTVYFERADIVRSGICAAIAARYENNSDEISSTYEEDFVEDAGLKAYLKAQ